MDSSKLMPLPDPGRSGHHLAPSEHPFSLLHGHPELTLASSMLSGYHLAPSEQPFSLLHGHPELTLGSQTSKNSVFHSKTMVVEVSTKQFLEVFCALFGRPGPPFGCPKAARSFPKDAQSPPQAPQGYQNGGKNR